MGAEVSTNGEEGSAEDAAPTKLQAALEKVPAPTWQTGAAANAPTPRETSGATLDGAGLFVIAGRGKEEEHSDVHFYGASGWQTAQSEGIPFRKRSGHSVVQATVDVGDGASPAGPALIVFGGATEMKGYLSDTPVLRLTSGSPTWSPTPQSGTFPVGRDKHSAVVIGGAMIVYGGFGLMPEEEKDDDDEGEEEEAEEGAGGEGGGKSLDMGWFDDVHSLDLSC